MLPLTPLDDSAYPDWDAAYLDNVGRLYRLMYVKVGNRPDAEDLTSEVFRAALGPLRLTAAQGREVSSLPAGHRPDRVGLALAAPARSGSDPHRARR